MEEHIVCKKGLSINEIGCCFTGPITHTQTYILIKVSSTSIYRNAFHFFRELSQLKAKIELCGVKLLEHKTTIWIDYRDERLVCRSKITQF